MRKTIALMFLLAVAAAGALGNEPLQDETPEQSEDNPIDQEGVVPPAETSEQEEDLSIEESDDDSDTRYLDGFSAQPSEMIGSSSFDELMRYTHYYDATILFSGHECWH